MRPNFNNMNTNPNMENMNNMFKLIYILSFITQWSFISMILNLFTLGLIRIPLFILFIIDALTMTIQKNKTLKRPSWILSKIWDIIDKFTQQKYNNQQNNYHKNRNIITKLEKINTKITNIANTIKNKSNNLKNNILNRRTENKKYNKEREINKFSEEIGNKVIVEYIEPGQKLHKKTFKYKDRLKSYIKVLENNGYKDYTKFNLNINIAPAYIIINKNRDIIDIEKNTIKLKHQNKDYPIVVNGWPNT